MKYLIDGGGIYSNGVEGSSMDNAEIIEGNVVLEQHHPSWGIYTDNGSEYVKVNGNVVFDVMYVPAAPLLIPGVSQYFSFGGCGEGPISYDGNFSIQPDPTAGLIAATQACGGHPLVGVTSTNNQLTSSQSQIPAGVLNAAGLELKYQSRFAPTPIPQGLPQYIQYPPPTS